MAILCAPLPAMLDTYMRKVTEVGNIVAGYGYSAKSIDIKPTASWAESAGSSPTAIEAEEPKLVVCPKVFDVT